MNVLENLYYTEDHEWVRVEGDTAYIGITDYAQNSLGSIVFVELPEEDAEISHGDDFGVIESVKAASDIYSPLTGKVIDFNQSVIDEPELLNQDPFENYLISLKMSDTNELDSLMDAQSYKNYISEEWGLMNPYIPNTSCNIEGMLQKVGVKETSELFSDISESVKLSRPLNLDNALSELEIIKHMQGLASLNKSTTDLVCFLGAGAYDHYIPSIIKHISSRSEFSTAYTPYQPEISQGTLQAIFEYQSLITSLTSMEISNASMYDGGTAMAEAALIACSNTRRKKVLISSTVHPESVQILKTYLKLQEIELEQVDMLEGSTSLENLEQKIDGNVACVIAQTPNFFGVLEDMQEISDIAHKHKAMFIASVNPISLGILTPPGEYNADFVVGEGQSLGNPLNFGGPYLGFLATTKKMMRKIPGRICGMTEDIDGKRAFVLTLQAREQHIRREKAISNICSNQGLNALNATIYLATLGKQGVREVAEQIAKKSYFAMKQITTKTNFKLLFDKPFFMEFALDLKEVSPQTLNNHLLDKGFLGGYDLQSHFSELGNASLLCTTEKRTKAEIINLVDAMGGLSWNLV